MATKKPQSPAMEFLVSALKANRNAVYADLKAKADAKKLKVFPIMFGRAQAMLGIVKSAKRGKGKVARAKASKSTATRRASGASKSDRIRELLKTGMSAGDIAKKVGATTALVYTLRSKGGSAKRGPGRPRKAAASVNVGGLAGILDAVKNGERERAQLRAALERIRGVLTDVLG